MAEGLPVPCRLHKDTPLTAQLPAVGRPIDTLILLNRAVDLITSCCTHVGLLQ